MFTNVINQSEINYIQTSKLLSEVVPLGLTRISVHRIKPRTDEWIE